MKIELPKQKDKKYILAKIIIYFILIVISILEIRLIFNNNIWEDEAFSMIVVKNDWSIFWKLIIGDVHPPLYYIILKLLTTIMGCNLQIAKIVSILPIFLTNIIVINLTVKSEKLSIKKVTLLILFLILTNLTSNFIYMGLEVRMYSWASFFVTISGIYAYKVYKKLQRKDIIIFIITSLGAALTHYFALIMEVVIYIILFVALLIKDKKNIGKIIKIVLCTIIGYIWWLPKALRQFIDVQNDYWITFTPEDILIYIKRILGTDVNDGVAIFIYIVIGIVLVNALYKLIKKKYKNKEKENVIFSICLISFPFLIIGIGSILNIILTPIFVDRYLTPAICLFWMGVINLLNYIDFDKILISILTIIIIILGIFGYKNKFANEMASGTNETLEFMKNNSKKGEFVITNIWGLYWSVFRYYFPQNKILYSENIKYLNKNEKVLWMFEDVNKKIDKKIYETEGYNVEYIYSGYIDNNYYFNLYKLYQ